MTLNEALTDCLRELNVRVEPNCCLWVMEKEHDYVWVYMETMDGEITSHRVPWVDLQHKIVTKKE